MSTKPAEETTTTKLSTRLAVEKLGVLISNPPKRKIKDTDPKKVKGRLRPDLEKYKWKRGETGNQKGRPKGSVSLTTLLKNKLIDHPEDAEALVNALIILGKRPNLSQLAAIDKIFDRVDGKVVEKHEISGELPVKILFVPARTVIGVEEPKELPQITETAGVGTGGE